VAAGFVRAKGGEGGHYFLASNNLRWPVIGLAMFAANISTVHLVSLAEAAYKTGLVFGNFEWMAGFVLILLALFFAPLYLRSRVATLPDFLERRFNRQCRDWLTVISIISAVFLHIGSALFTAAWVLRGIVGAGPTILGMDSLLFIIVVLGVLTGVYTMLGGLLAVVWTESVQTVLLLVGAICITIVGFVKVGGWEHLAQVLASHPHPLAPMSTPTDRISVSTANFLNMARPTGDPSGLPWYSILLGYPVLGIWYWCCDQTIVQRVLAARDEKHARLGPLFCAFIKILPVFFFVLPGTICLALVQCGAFGGDAPTSAKDTYTFMVTHLLPIGLKGLVTAALLAAAMQTCSAALNSAATLIAYDVVKRYRAQTTDHSLVFIGKVTTVVATIGAILFSPVFGNYPTIFEGLNKMISDVAPPITAVFLFGVFWEKASSKAAFITFVVGGVLGLSAFLLDRYGVYSPNFMLNCFYLFVICCLIMFVGSLVFPEELKKEARPLVWAKWSEPLHRTEGGWGLADYRVASAVVLCIFVALYIVFR